MAKPAEKLVLDPFFHLNVQTRPGIDAVAAIPRQTLPRRHVIRASGPASVPDDFPDQTRPDSGKGSYGFWTVPDNA